MYFTKKVSDFCSGQACVFEKVMEKIQNSWDCRCCIPGCIPAGRHLTPTFYLPAVLTKIIAAFLKGKEQSCGSQHKGDSSLRHISAGGHLFRVAQSLSCVAWCYHLGSVQSLQGAARTEWFIECATEEHNDSALQSYKGNLFPLACGLGHEGLLEHVLMLPLLF